MERYSQAKHNLETLNFSISGEYTYDKNTKNRAMQLDNEMKIVEYERQRLGFNSAAAEIKDIESKLISAHKKNQLLGDSKYFDKYIKFLEERKKSLEPDLQAERVVNKELVAKFEANRQQVELAVHGKAGEKTYGEMIARQAKESEKQKELDAAESTEQAIIDNDYKDSIYNSNTSGDYLMNREYSA